MANKDQTEKMCISYLDSNDETDPADVSEPTIRHSSVTGPERQTMQNDATPRNKMEKMDQIAHRIQVLETTLSEAVFKQDSKEVDSCFIQLNSDFSLFDYLHNEYMSGVITVDEMNVAQDFFRIVFRQYRKLEDNCKTFFGEEQRRERERFEKEQRERERFDINTRHEKMKRRNQLQQEAEEILKQQEMAETEEELEDLQLFYARYPVESFKMLIQIFLKQNFS